jgi:hypothetical protein
MAKPATIGALSQGGTSGQSLFSGSGSGGGNDATTETKAKTTTTPPAKAGHLFTDDPDQAAAAGPVSANANKSSDMGTFGLIFKLIIALVTGDWGALSDDWSALTGGKSNSSTSQTASQSGTQQSPTALPDKVTAATNLTTNDTKQQVNVPQAEITEGTLIALSNVTDASSMANVKGVAFYDEASKSFKAGDQPGAINEKSIARVSITSGGETHFYQRVAAVDGQNNTKTGLKATAWVETDDKGKILLNKDNKMDIHLAFDGFTGDPMGNSASANALKNVVGGKLNPQAIEASDFTDGVIKGIGKDKINNIIYGSYSMGASNALAAQAVSDLEGVTSKTSLLIEPLGATLAKAQIQAAMSDPNSDFSKNLQARTGASADAVKGEVAQLDKDIADHTISVRSIYNDGKGWQGTAVSYMAPREGLGLEGVQMAEVNRRTARAQGKETAGVLDSNPSNDMIGYKLFQNVTGDNTDLSPAASTVAKLDPFHQLSVIVNGEMNGDAAGKGSNPLLDFSDALKSANVTVADKSYDGQKPQAPQLAKTDGTAQQKGG